eukprot:4459207-Pleurochrysis_carterae.AAC.1
MQSSHEQRKSVRLNRILSLQPVSCDRLHRRVERARGAQLGLQLKERGFDSGRRTEALRRSHACARSQVLNERRKGRVESAWR